MVWTKAKTAFVASACALLAAATAIMIVLYNANMPLHGIPKDWTTLCGGDAAWTWANNKINAHSETGECILASGKEYRNVTLSAIVSTTNREASLAIRMQDANNGYIIIFAPGGTPRDDAGHIALVKKISGDETILASYHGRVFSSIGQSARVAVTAQGPLIEIRLNDVRVLRVTDTTFSTGLIGLRIFGDADSPCDSMFSNLTFH